MTKHEGFTLPSGYVLDGGVVYSTSGWRGETRRALVEDADQDGYRYVRVTVNGRREKRYLHRLITFAVHGAPVNGQQVRHLNGIPHDNRPENLAWGSVSENAVDRNRHAAITDNERLRSENAALLAERDRLRTLLGHADALLDLASMNLTQAGKQNIGKPITGKRAEIRAALDATTRQPSPSAQLADSKG